MLKPVEYTVMQKQSTKTVIKYSAPPASSSSWMCFTKPPLMIDYVVVPPVSIVTEAPAAYPELDQQDGHPSKHPLPQVLR